MLASCDFIEADHDSHGCSHAGAQPGCTLWQRISVMQIVRQLCTDAHFINFLCTIYDVAQVSVCCSGLAVPILLWAEYEFLCNIYEFAQASVCRSCLAVPNLVLTEVLCCVEVHEWCSRLQDSKVKMVQKLVRCCTAIADEHAGFASDQPDEVAVNAIASLYQSRAHGMLPI